MGVWHTHHQMFPEPSPIDWRDWYETLEVDRTGCEYVFLLLQDSGIYESGWETLKKKYYRNI